jgi:hypothetical protein
MQAIIIVMNLAECPIFIFQISPLCLPVTAAFSKTKLNNSDEKLT